MNSGGSFTIVLWKSLYILKIPILFLMIKFMFFVLVWSIMIKAIWGMLLRMLMVLVVLTTKKSIQLLHVCICICTAAISNLFWSEEITFEQQAAAFNKSNWGASQSISSSYKRAKTCKVEDFDNNFMNIENFL